MPPSPAAPAVARDKVPPSPQVASPADPAAPPPDQAAPSQPETSPAASAPGVWDEIAVPQALAVSSATADGPTSAAHPPSKPQPAVVPSAQPVGPVAAGSGLHLRTNGHGPVATPARVTGHPRRSPTATAAEQAAADLALLRTFGVARPPKDEPDVALEAYATDDDEPIAGMAQPVAFRVPARNGRGISGATVTLLDDHGRQTANTRTNPDGHGVLTAHHPGGYLLVVAATTATSPARSRSLSPTSRSRPRSPSRARRRSPPSWAARTARSSERSSCSYRTARSSTPRRAPPIAPSVPRPRRGRVRPVGHRARVRARRARAGARRRGRPASGRRTGTRRPPVR